MSHNVGTIQTLPLPIEVGPDSGDPSTGPNTWLHEFEHTPAPGGTKFVILHFQNASFPANNRLEVDLGYDTDVFTTADGAAFWTRPINIQAFPNGIPVRYITDGAGAGSVELDRYGRGESLNGDPGFGGISNCDPFLLSDPYQEPQYGDYWFCNDPPIWENVACVADATDIRRIVAQSVGMIVTVHASSVSTCSVTCIGPDLVLTAGHCFDDPVVEAATSSVIFNHATECNNARPGGYVGRFFKVIKVVKYHYGDGRDYCILQLEVPPGGLGVPVIAMRNDVPPVGEQVFGIHHPNGAVKKLSIPHPAFATVTSSNANRVNVDFDVSGGSSGSGLFDLMGRVVGVLTGSLPCNLGYDTTAAILDDIAADPEPPASRDVMIVFDRSGSMAEMTEAGMSKIEEARDAASLFVQLVRAGGGNRLGLVSFSTKASNPVDYEIANVTPVAKTDLVGPVPYTTGVVGGLAPGGATTIGGGLAAARDQFPVKGANPRTILLLTDGKQNTPPMIENVEPTLGTIGVNAIGFGTESNLNGDLLTQLAQNHDGLYMRAGSGLDLRKYFALAFGNIFEAGALMDPEGTIPRDQRESERIPFQVCDEETITVVVCWDTPLVSLDVIAKTPSGAVVTPTSASVEAATGRTWTFLRIPLPFEGDREGTWYVTIRRTSGSRTHVDVRYSMNVIAAGGPRLTVHPTGPTRYYTGDTINPLVFLRYPTGALPQNARVHLTVTRPRESVGNVLTRRGMNPPGPLPVDTPTPRIAALMAIERETGQPVTGYVQERFELFDDAAHNIGMFRRSGLFGNPLRDLLKVEGNYTFHARATYGRGCIGSREVTWTLHVDAGIDPDRSTIKPTRTVLLPDGRIEIVFSFMPRDKHGNCYGPGRPGDFTITGTPGTTVVDHLHDKGNGTYEVKTVHDPASGHSPGIVVTQPGRPPAVVCHAMPTG